jgi:hypothetical protein
MANEFKVKKGLIVDGSNTVLDIQGTQGQLFSVTDSLTGDLFSVSDISGIPILNVNSTGLVTVDGNLNLGDNNKIQFGDSQDLQIYHNANDSYINDTGTGDLRIVSSLTKIYDADMSHLQASFTDGGSVVLYNAGNEKLATTSTGISVTGKTTTGTAHFDGAANGSGVGAEIGRNHAYDTLELKGYGAEMMIGSQSTDIHINYRTCNSNTSNHTPNRWFWRAGSASSYSDHYFGKVFSTNLTFGNSTGASSTGKLIIQNDTSGNQGTAGYGILKQRDVNRQVVAGQSTHIGGYIWYTIKIPSGYSNSGLGSDVEVVIRTGGKHHNGKTLQKYIINVSNGSTASIGNFNDINILQTLDSRIGGAYGGSATAAEFYYRTSVANDTGEVILRLYRADREPVTVVEINPQGAWNNDITKTPSLTCHGLGTTFDSGTGKGQINQTRPTSNLSTALVVQKASFEQTSGTNGKFTVSANGPASGISHEIARFINVGSLATSSYMYIGASSGTDWRLGKNVMGASGNNNFEIAPHSGTTKYLEINSGTGVISANSGVYTPQYVQGNQALIKSSNNHAVFGSNSVSVPLGFARDSNHGTYTDMTISINGNTSIGGTTEYTGTGVKSFNIVGGDYPLLAFYNSTTLRSTLISYSNSTLFGHAHASAKWTFENGTAVMGELSGAGTFTAKGDVVAYGSPSDKRLKENIKPIESALDKVMDLQGVTFNWKKSDSILDIKEDIGFIAQDVKEVIPELVRENENGMLSMRHQGIAPILLEAIKELKQEIDELKKIIKNGNNL